MSKEENLIIRITIPEKGQKLIYLLEESSTKFHIETMRNGDIIYTEIIFAHQLYTYLKHLMKLSILEEKWESIDNEITSKLIKKK